MFKDSDRIAVFSDVHGNLDALVRGLSIADEQCCGEYYFLGDAIGYLTGLEALDVILSHPNLQAIRGNHEAFLLGESSYAPAKEDVYRLGEIRKNMSERQIRALREWPSQLELNRCAKSALLVHGSIENPTYGYVYPDSTLLESPFDVVFMGNTHRPFVRKVGRTTYVNVGSVGLPRDHGKLGAICIWEPSEDQISILRFSLTDRSLRAIRTAHITVQELWNRQVSSDQLVGEIVENV
jgi:predicted phosphodiesterase